MEASKNNEAEEKKEDPKVILKTIEGESASPAAINESPPESDKPQNKILQTSSPEDSTGIKEDNVAELLKEQTKAQPVEKNIDPVEKLGAVLKRYRERKLCKSRQEIKG